MMTDLGTLDAIQRRVLWLAVRMVDHANHDRPDAGGIKVGGHQASSASMVTIMTALWFAHLKGRDLVSVKPHASPVLHAIWYLLGDLDRSYLTRLRDLGGLQAYPSRTKDPDRVDFSTGSVGLGAVAPLFGAVARRWVEAHFGDRPRSRFVGLIGDAELDEGNVWEALADPSTRGLGNVLWVVDLNRQSLDRVIPGIKAANLKRLFTDSGWQVLEAKYGRRLQEAFALPGGGSLRQRIDDMPNEEYQSLFALPGAEQRDRVCAGADPAVKRLLERYTDDELPALIQNLGGHDLAELLHVFAKADADRDRPSVVFAYTVKGWGLPIAGDPLNHAALLSRPQIDELRASLGLDVASEWDRFDPASPEGRSCEAAAARLRRETREPARAIAVPDGVGSDPGSRPVSTQEAFGRLLIELSRVEGVAERIVTTSPDVSVSTNLGGWINRMGVFSPIEEPDWLGPERLLRWRPSPSGHHIELGISEMNLFLLLGQLGLARELSGETLLPIGTVYDPFVCRGLDAFIYSVYSASRFVIVGTPSGVTLAPEGGAHQSSITASIGLELPGVTYSEPAYARALDWMLCDALAQIADPDGSGSHYLRLSTRPVDQTPFARAVSRLGPDEARRQALAGGYRLLESAAGGPLVHLFASGAVIPEVLEAAEMLADEGVRAHVTDVTSLDRLHRGWRSAVQDAVGSARGALDTFHLATLLPTDERAAPIVTVHDAASHAMSWIGSVFGARVIPLGVDAFGQSGAIHDLYGVHQLLPGQIVNAALLALA